MSEKKLLQVGSKTTVTFCHFEQVLFLDAPASLRPILRVTQGRFSGPFWMNFTRFGKLPSDMSATTLASSFTLGPDDLELIRACRGARNRLGYAVLLSSVRFAGTPSLSEI